ncbi:MAG: hypothetical protein IT209_01130 [Armatimonadetes bacterium]|nr:hypothetical protein [Armatimonadota bacterium]
MTQSEAAAIIRATMAGNLEASEALHVAEKIARELRSAISPALDRPDIGEAVGVAASGDTTFSADLIAEDALKRAVDELKVPVACYSEDEGLVETGPSPEWLLIVDPIDGTRPAAAGLETCVVSVAVARLCDKPVMGDVVAGAVYELRRDRLYLGSRGGGAFQVDAAGLQPLTPRPPKEFCELRWTLETVARPALFNFTAVRRLIDETSLRGSLFSFSSSAFSLCQIAAGRFSGMVDLSARILRDCDPEAGYMRQVGHGRIMGMWAYDIAAAALIATEAGCVVTDAWGGSLDDLILTRCDPQDMASCICASSPEYHARMLELINAGFEDCRNISPAQSGPGGS